MPIPTHLTLISGEAVFKSPAVTRGLGFMSIRVLEYCDWHICRVHEESVEPEDTRRFIDCAVDT